MGAQRLIISCFRYAAFVVALILIIGILTIPAVAQQSTPGTPEVAVVFNLRSSDLAVIDHKYRVFYNKFEKKNLPIEGYDLQAAIRDEVMNTLAEDKRYKWRVATEADKLDTTQIANDKNWRSEMFSSAQADRVLVIDVEGFGAFISGLAKDRMEVVAHATMLDRGTGKKLWKQRIWEKIPFSGDLQTLQADNQKELKEGVNSLIEKTCQKLMAKVAESKG